MATPNVNHTFVVQARPEDVQRQLLAVAGTDGYQLIGQTHGGLGLRRRRIPVWAIVLAVVFFPFGLLFLLVKNEEIVTVEVERTMGGTRVGIHGRASRGIQYAIQAALGAWQVAGAPAPRWPAPAGAGVPPPPPPGSGSVPPTPAPAAAVPTPAAAVPTPAPPREAAQVSEALIREAAAAVSEREPIVTALESEPAADDTPPGGLPAVPPVPPPAPTPPLGGGFPGGGSPGGAPPMPLGPIGGPPGGMSPPPAAPPGGLAPMDLPDLPRLDPTPPEEPG